MTRKLEVQIVGDASSLNRAFGNASKSAGSFGSKMALASKLVAAGAGAMGLGFGYVVKQAADFQSSMNDFQVVSQANSKQMRQASALAKKLGADLTLPATSASDAAKAMVELSKAGLKTKDVFAAAKGVLQLSAAAEVDNATAAQIAANNLNAFHLEGSKATHVADLLAAASIAASGSMTDMSDALGYTAATAAQAHVSIEDTVAAISEMANKGIIGGQAGAALQQMLLKLESPTKKGAAAIKGLGVEIYDAHGKMKPLPSLIDQFTSATHGMSDAQRNAAMNSIFGSRAIRAANIVLLGGKDAFDKMRTAVDRNGAAADVAKAKMKGFHGAVEGLKSQVQTLAISLGTPLLGPLTGAIHGLSGFLGALDAAKGTHAKFEVIIDAGKGLAQKIETGVGDAVAAVDWNKVWGRARGVAAGLERTFEHINWSSVGSAIGTNFSAAVDKAISGTSGLPSAFERAFKSIDWNKLGRAAGPGLAAAIVSAFAALTSPGFWLKNWDLALAIALAVFPYGRFVKIGVLLERVFAPMILRLAGVIERLSPRLAEAILVGFLKLPGLLRGAFGNLEGLVGKAFGKLGRLARFTVKVLGIQAAIDAVVGMAQSIWNEIKALPGQMVAIGAQIPAGLASGIRAGIGSVVGAVKDMVGSIPGFAKKLLHINSPSKVMMDIGEMISLGLAIGITRGEIGVQKAVTAAADAASRAALAGVAKLQHQMDAIARERENRDQAAAIADAEKAVAAARKKGKGLADAEKQLQQALEARADTMRQRELDKAQRHADRLVAAAQHAHDRLVALQEKAAAKLQKLQDKALAAFDAFAAKVRKAFDAKNASWVAPAQAAIDAIMGRRHTEDMQQAVTDAQKALADAQSGLTDANALTQNDGETDAEFAARKLAAITSANDTLLKAQRDYERAKEDITIAGYESDATSQTKAHDQLVDSQSEALDDWLSVIRGKIETGKETWDQAMQDFTAIIGKYDGPFSDVAGLLGQAFVDSLVTSIKAAATGAGALANPGAAGASAATRPDDRAGAHGINGTAQRVTNVTVNADNYVGSKEELGRTIRDQLTRMGRRDPNIFGGYA